MMEEKYNGFHLIQTIIEGFMDYLRISILYK